MAKKKPLALRSMSELNVLWDKWVRKNPDVDFDVEFWSDEDSFCCGILRLGRFPGGPVVPRGLHAAYHLRLARSIRQDMEDADVNLATVSTVPSQSGVNTALKAIGFKPLVKTKNPNSGNVITVWALKLG